MLFFELKTDLVAAVIGNFHKAFDQPERKKNIGVPAQRDARIAFLQFVQCASADGGARRKDRDRNAAPLPGVPNILPDFAERPSDRDRCLFSVYYKEP